MYNFAEMVEYIQQLLFTNNCVITPGFGAFIGNYQSAEISLSENKVFPPSKNIAFNRTLQANDGLLTNFVAQQESISYLAAEEKVNTFAKYCNDTLLHNKSLIFKNIGRFTLDAEQKIQFQPFAQVNYLADSFGLTALSLAPIHRLKDTGIEIQENYQRVLHPELITDAVTPKNSNKKKNQWILAILFVAITTTLIGWNVKNNHSGISYASLFPMFDNVKPKAYTLPKTVETTQSGSKFIQHKIAIANNEIAENHVVIDSLMDVNAVKSKTKSYIVIGTFFDKSRAEKLQAESDKMGFATNISTENKDALYRVTVAVENKDVTASLDKIKSTLNPRAWVFCRKCDLK